MDRDLHPPWGQSQTSGNRFIVQASSMLPPIVRTDPSAMLNAPGLDPGGALWVSVDPGSASRAPPASPGSAARVPPASPGSAWRARVAGAAAAATSASGRRGRGSRRRRRRQRTRRTQAESPRTRDPEVLAVEPVAHEEIANAIAPTMRPATVTLNATRRLSLSVSMPLRQIPPARATGR